ncbi:MAG: sorbosone dehydrogenase family protein [Cyclobacteriaceae bacterium]|nr:sorbosone dehydrogenase family protein [Cyclobacteriaceae bacterium]
MKNKRFKILSAVLIITSLVASFKIVSNSSYQNLPLSKIQLPQGFKIDIYAHVPNARSMVLSERGTLFVGNRSGDKVYAVKDTDGDNVADKVYIIDEGLNMPNGVALKDGDLYVAAVSKLLKYENIEDNLENQPEPKVIFDGYPTERHHGWKYIAFGPDGLLYIPVGAPCNVCEKENDIYATITRLDVNNPVPQIVAKGVRNTVGFDWDPITGDLWFTDNGRDMMGDDIPPCELNQITSTGLHFGFPFCHGGEILDQKFGKERTCDEFEKPVWKFGAHVAPLGMKFYSGNQFPPSFKNAVFIAQHGSWNRSRKVGYKVMIGVRDGIGISSIEPFATGWLDEETQMAWGRPVDILQMPDGSLLVSDDYADVIYRISYKED